ncbi:T9SS type A sorting domain-containing protein [Hymenobacter sp. UV11]|nr:T9SS type A sorting domain-containing protein [Hymenobacter sp. UV11]
MYRVWKARVTLLLSLLLCGLSSRSFAAADSKGTDFWLTFPGNLSSGTTLTLFITGEVATTGTVSIASPAFTTTFSVTPGAVTSVVVPAGAELFTSDVVANNGIHVTSGQEVTVYGLNRQQYTTDAYLALPTDVLGTQYINLGYLNSELTNVMGTQFALVGTVNGTVVTITPTVTAGTRVVGVPYNITLNQGQTYLLRSTGAYPSDLSGTLISATQPISVFGSNKCANVPHNHEACDYLVEQLPPTTAWGKQFVSVPLKTRLNGDTFRFLASTNNTQVRVNGTLVATLNRGQYHERVITSSAQITSTEPILVAQYSNSSSYDNVVSDPFMMLIPPLEQFLGSYTVTTPASGFLGNYINVVAPNAAVGTVRLDGVVVPAGSFSAIGSSGYSGAQLTVSLGVHQLTGGIYPIGAFVYGFDTYDSYGYPGGQSFAPVATVSSLALTPATGTAQTGSSYCVAAAVKDQFNNPVVGVRVDFAVSGVNSTSGFATTDAAGVAPFCYTGTNAGADNVVASLGGLSRTVQVTWSGSCQAPTNVAVTSVTSTTASVGFNGSSTASGGYTVRYTPSGGAAQTMPATASPVVLTGLTPNTTYAVTVTSNCAGTQTATSTPAVSFTTSPLSPVCNRNVNQPVATPDQLVASAGPLTFTAAQLLANDSDPRNRALRVSHVGEPSAGTLVTNADGTYTYTAPYPGYTGPVTFSYTIEGAGPVIASSGTYHYYEFVSAPGICWTDAAAAAAAHTYEGMQGYLATVTFAGEKDFLTGQAMGQYWIGAADEAVEGEWRWKTGPEAGQLFWRGAATGIGSAYANWSPGQPDDFHNFGHPEGEDYGIFYGNSGYWNDVNNCNTGGTTAGYLVEYGGLEPCVPILYSLGTVTIMVGPSMQQSIKATAIAALRTATGEQTLQVTPNPSTGQFRVQVLADMAGPSQLDLFDMQGRLVRSLFTGSLLAGESREVAVDAPDLSAGIYIMRLQRGQQVQHLRMLIRK